MFTHKITHFFIKNYNENKNNYKNRAKTGQNREKERKMMRCKAFARCGFLRGEDFCAVWIFVRCGFLRGVDFCAVWIFAWCGFFAWRSFFAVQGFLFGLVYCWAYSVSVLPNSGAGWRFSAGFWVGGAFCADAILLCEKALLGDISLQKRVFLEFFCKKAKKSRENILTKSRMNDMM